LQPFLSFEGKDYSEVGIIDTARALMSLGFLEPVYVSPREEASGRSEGSLVPEQLLMMAFTRVEITITISTAILIKNNNLLLYSCNFSALIVIIISDRVVFLSV